MSSTPDPQSPADRAASFSTGADVYARVRPTYPADAVDWMVPPKTAQVLDLGAGTGLLTRRLVDRGLDVVAVDASRPMLDELAATLPGVTTHVGSAEELPLPDASVDTVVVGQAWHWFDEARASAEIARVLRAGGTLAVVWNDRDERIDWVSRFGEILHTGDQLQPDSEQSSAAPALGEMFGEVEVAEFRWLHHLPTADLRALAGSRSYFLTLPEPERDRLLQRVDDLVVTHPDLAGTQEIAMPYVTTAYRARRR
ncbi:methyltransferase domain-containing protein [Isoptericola sp. S6320L]|uniref:class I SAM-dependent methyltransferase n=1 Tax=Isoptericola sp. S6320L TaxID=2926411 RepID=UPI001FF46E91|nr:class I SAM-dependent methyltransferase [Isoptericola sp. S6320L]MCK0117963.1 methyltransferase domain-containing protein [Isoptericola sp. S6320L]